MKFTKMHGIGNDYVYVNCFEENLVGVDLPKLAIEISDRHFGAGGDGMILIMPSDQADFRMRMFNNDGSEGKTCGNGLRCVAKYVYDHGLTDKTTFTIETLGGIVTPELTIKAGKTETIRIDMGQPRVLREEIPMTGPAGTQVVGENLAVGDQVYEITCVSMGNPHCVIFVDDIEKIDVTGVGSQIEWHPSFPERTNVEFIQVVKDDEMIFRVWERGTGITLACGTGACAAGVAGVLRGKTSRQVTIHLPGGDLQIEWAENNHVFMTGPASEVFTGDWPLK